ncbi:MAG: D-alanyl-D-alanine carboxypeptidase [Clostridia bacterium]|nr:D-alanyl-D-alanine carboxypeptidase [Clostridia bacterium]
MKKKICIVLLLILTCGIFILPTNLSASYATFESSESCKSSVLIDMNTKKILYENNAHDRVPIASVTKLMTILLTLENVQCGNISLSDKVVVSENANSMGGSQIFLDANVQYELSELLKSVIVASANDSSVAIAEYIAGSENNFVRMMNERAQELDLKNTNYSNCTGLPTPDGYSSAYDQAIILSNVLNYDTYHNYSSIWMEDFKHPSGRTTQMTNTNRLSRFYEGCIGGKTGSTNQAKYCLAVGAKRNDTSLISVVLGADNSKDRFKLASDLLNYGFSNYTSTTLFSDADLNNRFIKIKGHNRQISLKAERNFTFAHNKNQDVNYSLIYNLPNMLISAKENQIVGNVQVVVDGVIVDTINILSKDTVDELTVWDYIKEITTL